MGKLWRSSIPVVVLNTGNTAAFCHFDGWKPGLGFGVVVNIHNLVAKVVSWLVLDNAPGGDSDCGGGETSQGLDWVHGGVAELRMHVWGGWAQRVHWVQGPLLDMK